MSSKLSGRLSPIVRTLSTQRRINLEVEVTALNQSAARTPKARPICRQRVQTLGQQAGRAVTTHTFLTPHRSAPPRKKVSTESAETDTLSASVVNTLDDRKRNGITYGARRPAGNGRVEQRREPFG